LEKFENIIIKYIITINYNIIMRNADSDTIPELLF